MEGTKITMPAHRLFTVNVPLKISAGEALVVQEAEARKGEEIGQVLSRLLQKELEKLVVRATMKSDQKKVASKGQSGN
jgi:hypothetical protein